ncbi:hypothetical protein TNCT_7421 [Trichonephila clavata]|uniref:Uncharacterized protein n=1 Tax=Trichonephila clavata TaxID=2740835 RepID=A0A8X6J1C4_TRICU|nr:hypothetical protein TNCT_7421 [Trichonephila clavata]
MNWNDLFPLLSPSAFLVSRKNAASPWDLVKICSKALGSSAEGSTKWPRTCSRLPTGDWLVQCFSSTSLSTCLMSNWKATEQNG